MGTNKHLYAEKFTIIFYLNLAFKEAYNTVNSWSITEENLTRRLCFEGNIYRENGVIRYNQ